MGLNSYQKNQLPRFVQKTYAVSPYEVLAGLSGVNIKFIAREKGIIVSDTHLLKLVTAYDISEIESADILLIPGSVVGFIRESKNNEVLQKILFKEAKKDFGLWDILKNLFKATSLTHLQIKKKPFTFTNGFSSLAPLLEISFYYNIFFN
jgi:hypothetical protein